MALACCAMGACSGSAVPQDASGADAPATETSATHPVSGLDLIEVVVDTGTARHTFTTELAGSAEAQRQGLMFRSELGDFEAMLFPSATPQARSFWMKNTPLPLDIIFIGPGQRITNIERGEPYSSASVRSEGPAIAVLEIRGGRAEALGIGPGDRVEYIVPE